jgi:polar amino acid transport system substrate-binding protein
MVQSGTNVMTFPLGRTEERENQYKWVGQITVSHSVVFALAGKNIRITSVEDMKKYVVGTRLSDIREDYMLKSGFVQGQNLESVTTDEANYEKLKKGRIDLWPMEDLVMAYVVRQAGDDPKTAVTGVYPLDNITGKPFQGGFMAFGPGASDDLVARLHRDLETVKRDGTLAAITGKWMK